MNFIIFYTFFQRTQTYNSAVIDKMFISRVLYFCLLAPISKTLYLYFETVFYNHIKNELKLCVLCTYMNEVKMSLVLGFEKFHSNSNVKHFLCSCSTSVSQSKQLIYLSSTLWYGFLFCDFKTRQ